MGQKAFCEVVAVWPWPATKGHAVTLSPLCPAGVGRRLERKRQKLVDWDKGSLTEQQTKRTVTTIMLIGRIYDTNSGKSTEQLSPLDAQRPPEPQLASPLASCPSLKQA